MRVKTDRCRFQQNSFKSGSLQPRMQPLRQWPRLKSYRLHSKTKASKKATRAAGSLEIFASFTILPRAFTTQTTVPMTRRSLHSVPWLSSVSRCLGPTQRRDPVSSSIGGQPPQRSLAAGPITASSDSPRRHEPCRGRPNKTTPYIRRSPAAEKACRRGETPASGVRRPHPTD
jgi:hypothetical protein